MNNLLLTSWGGYFTKIVVILLSFYYAKKQDLSCFFCLVKGGIYER